MHLILPHTGGAGGSGVVIIKEPEREVFVASGVWNMTALYDNVKADNWA